MHDCHLAPPSIFRLASQSTVTSPPRAEPHHHHRLPSFNPGTTSRTPNRGVPTTYLQAARGSLPTIAPIPRSPPPLPSTSHPQPAASEGRTPRPSPFSSLTLLHPHPMHLAFSLIPDITFLLPPFVAAHPPPPPSPPRPPMSAPPTPPPSPSSSAPPK